MAGCRGWLGKSPAPLFLLEMQLFLSGAPGAETSREPQQLASQSPDGGSLRTPPGEGGDGGLGSPEPGSVSSDRTCCGCGTSAASREAEEWSFAF